MPHDGSIDSRAKREEFHIAFDVQSTPGHIRAVKVTIEADMIPDDTGMSEELQERFNIALANHPLYHHLRTYCLNNK